MAKRRGDRTITKSYGEVVQPVGHRWERAPALVYTRVFSFTIDRDEQGWLVGSVPELPGCHTQARSEHELIERLREAVELALEDSGDLLSKGLFVSARS
jgi:predicted RNase H-like HicB family nuclease